MDQVEESKLEADHDLALMLNQKVDIKMARQKETYRHIHNSVTKNHKKRLQKRRQEKLSRRRNRD